MRAGRVATGEEGNIVNRRGFLGTCLALGVAPAIVRADSLMRIVPRETGVFVPWFVDPALLCRTSMGASIGWIIGSAIGDRIILPRGDGPYLSDLLASPHLTNR